MSEYSQIGVTALRDPVTGEPLEAVPLYMRRADVRPETSPVIRTGPLARDLAGMMDEYLKGLAAEGMTPSC